ncbi:hypothetical protein BBO99_00004146 [Phytophthora kernoviae]|uniref:Uncharacterized protein n=1 Tax=Phytophthora kernoviae TaxID=325452 RepID=A0A3R7IR30_9STRA|nr:hypothetical protein JM16_003876 [Phytophthora kernoviae]RLN46323.1 hypothetical protein BBI17_004839 [Phytophthora kernoviae]RLN80908.1 hypothetical protein BBO99_00004146 [Phytophthora kernoviae]
MGCGPELDSVESGSTQVDSLESSNDNIGTTDSGSSESGVHESDSTDFDTMDSGSDEATSTESDSSDHELYSYPNSGYTDCTDVSIEGDATYCIEGVICSGEGKQPMGYACPVKHDVAISDCNNGLRSFMGGECYAPMDSVCRQSLSGAWGCVWEDTPVTTPAPTTMPNPNESTEIPVYPTTSNSNEGDTPSVTPATTDMADDTPSVTPATTETTDTDCTEVSVNGDATYCISGAICSGDGDAPVGDRCPVLGDTAIGDCHDYLPSYKDGKCVAPTEAMCQKIETGAWGCVWGGDIGASYAIGTTDAANAASASSGVATVVGAVAGVLLAAVIAVGAIMWSRKKRNQRARNPAHDADIMEAVLTPPSSVRGGSFHRV